MPTILLENRTFNYTIVKKPIRSLNIRLTGPDSLKITCPRLISDRSVVDFIRQHQNWILKNSSKAVDCQSLSSLKTISILGESYEILIRHTARDSVVIFKEEHKVYANVSSLSEGHIKKILDLKFRPLALKLIIAELNSLSSQFGFNYNRVSVKNTTSRFGSCSHQNNLNFNWQVILLPPNLFRHILIHELCHTIHHNHSAFFWSKVADCDPRWLQNRRTLRRDGSKYFIV